MANLIKELPVAPAGPDVRGFSTAEPIVGIDLGTTNSLVAIVEKGVPRVIPSREGRSLVPSVVHFRKGAEPEIGFAARRQRVLDSEHTIYSVKRLLGRGAEDLKQILHHVLFDLEGSSSSNVRIRIEGKTYTPIEISAMILRELKAAAEDNLGRPVEDAVITVPAYFNDSQRQATRAAGRLAGFNVLRILNEPTAAALAYGLHHKKNGLIAVYDFGGGTFDISILRLRDGIFEVLSTNGDTQLGGDDIDHAIARWLGFRETDSREARAKLLDQAESLKIALSEKESAEAGGVTLTRLKLAELARPLLERTRAPVENALRDAGLSTKDLTDVVLVGGPTRLPLIRDYVAGLLGRKPNASMHPDEVVAVGAAIQADILAGNNTEFLLLDVVPLSLGIETFGGAMSKLIPRNTRIPTVAKEQFTTFVDGQTKVAINVFQGERELVRENRKLAEFVLHGIPPLPAGAARVELTFLVDADGILSVSAKEIYSGIEQSIEVRPSYGLSDAEVERMLAEGLKHKDSDARARQVIEAKNNAHAVLDATERSLPRVRGKLDAEEVKRIESLIAGMKKAMETENAEAITAARKALDQGTAHMAEVLMNLTLDEDMKNRKASDFVKK